MTFMKIIAYNARKLTEQFGILHVFTTA